MKSSLKLYFVLGLFFCLGCTAKLPISNAYNDLAAHKTEEKSSNEIVEAKEEEIIIPFAPPKVEASFKQTYPFVMLVAWTKVVPFIKILDNKNVEYKAIFKFQQDEHTLLYAENGVLIETRIKMDVSALTTDLKLAIERVYPGSSLLEATTLKSIRNKGAYAVTITQANQHEKLELIMMEDGTFL